MRCVGRATGPNQTMTRQGSGEGEPVKYSRVTTDRCEERQSEPGEDRAETQMRRRTGGRQNTRHRSSQEEHLGKSNSQPNFTAQ